jgi:integrase/recombinase XerD
MEIDKKTEVVSKKFEKRGDKLLFGFFENFKSAHTKKAYKADLKNYSNFLKSNFPVVNLLAVDHDHLVAYQTFLLKCGALNGTPLSDSTVKRRISAVSKFYNYLGERKLVPENPCRFINRVKVPLRVKTQKVGSTLLKELLGQAKEASHSSFAGKLHYAVLMTMFSTGIRMGELVALKVGDFKEFSKGKGLLITAKGGKQLQKFLRKEVIEAIESYLEACENAGYFMDSDRPLFRSSRIHGENQILGTSTVQQIFKKYAKLAGIKHHIRPHTARKTYITEARKQFDLRAVQNDVGHSSIMMTNAYDESEENMSLEISESIPL